MFRNPTRAQRFPVLLVRDAEDGSLLARWQIGASMVFESGSGAIEFRAKTALSRPKSIDFGGRSAVFAPFLEGFNGFEAFYARKTDGKRVSNMASRP